MGTQEGRKANRRTNLGSANMSYRENYRESVLGLNPMGNNTFAASEDETRLRTHPRAICTSFANTPQTPFKLKANSIGA